MGLPDICLSCPQCVDPVKDKRKLRGQLTVQHQHENQDLHCFAYNNQSTYKASLLPATASQRR